MSARLPTILAHHRVFDAAVAGRALPHKQRQAEIVAHELERAGAGEENVMTDAGLNDRIRAHDCTSRKEGLAPLAVPRSLSL
ncbi:MAG: hypothetical protein EOS26_03360 [Mesorhizobium sp.]|nr:MAG: hypothetical protein EOS26_03360 [Mesorhizobium sp.]